MNKEQTENFAKQWIAAWNSHAIDAIMNHYSETIEFQSPFIQLLKFNESGIITSKADLKVYFEIGLKNYPELYFQFHDCLVGINTIVIYYTSVSGRKAAEVFELDSFGKAIKVQCNYSEPAVK